MIDTSFNPQLLMADATNFLIPQKLMIEIRFNFHLRVDYPFQRVELKWLVYQFYSIHIILQVDAREVELLYH